MNIVWGLTGPPAPMNDERPTNFLIYKTTADTIHLSYMLWLMCLTKCQIIALPGPRAITFWNEIM